MRGIKVKKLYNGRLNSELEKAVVIIDGEKIKDVFSEDNAEKYELYKDTEILDYSDYYMMPGLVDCHVHLMFPGNNLWGNVYGEYIVKNWSEGEINIMAFRNAMNALWQGVTTMRDCGSYKYAAANVRNAIKNQHLAGPDIVACGAPITCTGGHCYYMGGEADGPWEIRKKIRQQQKDGADFIKLMGTYGGTIGVTKTLTFSDEELLAAIDEAHLRNMKIAVHSCTVDMTEKLSKLNVDTIEHTVLCTADSSRNILDEKIVEGIIKNNIYITYTVCCVKGNIEALKKLIDTGKATQADIENYMANVSYDELTVENFRFQAEKNVPYVVGTDAGWRSSDFKTSFYDNLYVMERNGADSMTLIHASTLRGARAIGMDKIVGSVEGGKQADMLILKKDPAKDIAEAIKKPDYIIKKGCFI